jgi:hypothetical protein
MESSLKGEKSFTFASYGNRHRSILNGLTLDMEESSQAWEPVRLMRRLLRPARSGIFLRSRAG